MDFDEYVAARGQALLRFAYVLTSDRESAEDLTQAALADAYRHWRKVSRADHPDAYVRRIVVNRYLGWRRKRSWHERPADVADEQLVVVPDHADGVVARDETRRILDGLAPRARAVLVLRYYADLSDAAIAEAMGLSPSSVRATASRALSALRDQHAVAMRASNIEEM